ncbi:MAG TPA: hypothetical protein VNB49_06390 [Candidatus Dormibacteraeota bacterium]|nr:hypothetical protein [Candidatus Dormibacteraeota bacterium]
MNIFSNPPTPFFAVIPAAPQSTSELRWQLAAAAINVVLLSIGLAGLSFFFLRRKTGDRSLVFLSLFSLLYAVHLIFKQSFVQSLVVGPSNSWQYIDLFIDCVIVIPLTLFLIEIVQARWKIIIRCFLVLQAAFEGLRFLSVLLSVGQQSMNAAHSVIIVVFCMLLAVYPFSFGRGHRLPREVKAL